MEGVLYVRSDRKDKRGRSEVYLMLHFENKRLRIPTGEKALPAEWNEAARQFSKSAEQSKLRNARINQVKALAQEKFLTLTLAGQQVTPAALLEAIRPRRSAAPAVRTVFDYLEKWKQDNKGKLAVSYLSNADKLMNRLKRYTELQHIKELLPADLTESFWSGYETYLLAGEEKSPKCPKGFPPLGKGSINLQRAFGKLARELAGISGRTTFLKAKAHKRKHPFLTWAELQQIRFHHYEKLHLQQEADTFIFQCLTGLRDSDLRKIGPADLQTATVPEIGQVNVISLLQTKTKDLVMIPLHPIAFGIWERYSGRLCIKSTSTRNTNLKDVAQEAKLKRLVRDGDGKEIELWQAVSTHTARRTCGNLIYGSTEDMKTAQTMLGHASPSSTQIYVQENDTRFIRAVIRAHETLGDIAEELAASG